MATHALTAFDAEDGVARTPSEDASVHRALIAVDPPMAGKDVVALQTATRARLKARGLGDDIPVPAHGKFTPATALACLEAQYFLGMKSDAFLLEDAKGHRVITEEGQRIIRDPSSRDAGHLQRAADRSGQLKRGPRYYEQLAKELGIASGKGVQAALSFAVAQIGVKEQPAGSNWGPKIQDWIRAAGYDSPVPWCGCFVNACIMAGGLPSGAGWIGYTPSILSRAKAGKDGWSFHDRGEPGDLALFDTPGGDPAVHVEIVRERLSDTRYRTIGGNTSSGAAGSQSNGGMVAARDDRSTVGGFRIIGFARPPWK
jgi:hypothetical protein